VANTVTQEGDGGVTTAVLSASLSTCLSKATSSVTSLSTAVGSAGGFPGAKSILSAAAPAGPNSTAAFTMQGLAGSITPARSGNILIFAYGSAQANTDTSSGHGIFAQISYGTGIAPTSNAALTGTQVGLSMLIDNAASGIAASTLSLPFTILGVVSGLTVNTAYWLDIASKGLGAADWTLNNVVIGAIELP
jgi:hypothetical protein